MKVCSHKTKSAWSVLPYAHEAIRREDWITELSQFPNSLNPHMVFIQIWRFLNCNRIIFEVCSGLSSFFLNPAHK